MLAFLIESIGQGVGLAMDAFSVSMVDGLSHPKMKRRRLLLIAGTFALFQALMPLTGWVCVHTIITIFKDLAKFVPVIAMLLLGFIGGKMLYDGIKGCEENECVQELTLPVIITQGIATSIDALSVGFTIAAYDLKRAVLCALIIAVVTFVICFSGLIIGKRFGTAISGKATVFGGIVLIAIGIQIFVTGVLV